jgi:DNA polymerase
MADLFAPQTLSELNERILAAEATTRAVLGEGPSGAALAFVGEQPGDDEDRAGRPFVGPAGKLLNRAFAEAGVVREASYLTNAVKHFKFEQRGKRRLHKKPSVGEIEHARWWLNLELSLVAPRLIVALGATAARALAGRALAVAEHRGPISFLNRPGYLTVHPAYVLRLPEPELQAQAYADLVEDLRRAQALAQA